MIIMVPAVDDKGNEFDSVALQMHWSMDNLWRLDWNNLTEFEFINQVERLAAGPLGGELKLIAKMGPDILWLFVVRTLNDFIHR